jgi:hypothetical protein
MSCHLCHRIQLTHESYISIFTWGLETSHRSCLYPERRNCKGPGHRGKVDMATLKSVHQSSIYKPGFQMSWRERHKVIAKIRKFPLFPILYIWSLGIRGLQLSKLPSDDLIRMFRWRRKCFTQACLDPRNKTSTRLTKRGLFIGIYLEWWVVASLLAHFLLSLTFVLLVTFPTVFILS